MTGYQDELPKLSDGVVTLRELRETDFSRLAESARDPLAIRYTVVPDPYSDDDSTSFYRDIVVPEWATGSRVYWAIAVADVYVGGIDIQARNRVPSLGYLMHPQARGHGYCTRAIRLAVESAYRDFALPVVRWVAAADNVASLRAATSAGLQLEGRLHRSLLLRDQVVDANTGYFPNVTN